jgi:hypothetical protein
MVRTRRLPTWVRALGVLALVALAAACDTTWPTLGFGPARTGHNPFERTVGVDNVDELQQAWSSTPLPGGASGSSPVVAGGSVYVTAGQLLVFSADGSSGCSGSPVVCKPLWTAAQGGSLTPTVAGNFVYTTAAGSVFAFDARGINGCAGSPKVCSPRWRASIGGIAGSVAVVGGVLYVGSDDPGRLYAFDADGTTGCSGSPKVCSPLWRSSGIAGSTPAVNNGVVYTTALVPDASGDRLSLSAFDAAGSTNCSGTPKVCAPLWKFQREVHCDNPCRSNQPPSVAGGRVYLLIGECCDSATASTTLVTIDAPGEKGCSGVPKRCEPLSSVRVNQADLAYARPPAAIAQHRVFVGDLDLVAFAANGLSEEWRAQANLSSPSVANGVVYVMGGRVVGLPGYAQAEAFAFDASGQQSCSGSPRVCSPLWHSAGGPIDDTNTIFFEDWAPPIVANGTVFVRLERLRAYRVPGS